jgi:1-acyl-sn-glycerol-3-phosphate acyltransferase
MCLPKKWLYQSKIFFWLCDVFYRLILFFSMLPIKIVGKENIPREPAIIIANHQSSLDIPLIGYVLHRFPHIWLAKAELMDSPILRFVLPRVAVLTDMSSPYKGMRSLIRIINLMNGKRIDVIIFPEGSRFTDGSIHDFFSGFVILAKKTGKPVVPIRIFGLNKAYPPDTFLIYRVPIKMIIGKPFIYQETDTEESFKERVYNWFLEQKED